MPEELTAFGGQTGQTIYRKSYQSHWIDTDERLPDQQQDGNLHHFFSLLEQMVRGKTYQEEVKNHQGFLLVKEVR